MSEKVLKTDFAKFTFMDNHTVMAEANDGINIDANKVKVAIDLIEQELPGDYGLILNRNSDYSVTPIEVYQFFASIKRLKAIAIVRANGRDFLPNNLEKELFGNLVEKFTSIPSAHEWMKTVFVAEE